MSADESGSESGKMIRLPEVSAGGSPLFFIAGPCMMESRELVLETAERLALECGNRGAGLIFKSSFDKANRTAGGSARGLGMEKGLALLGEVRNRFRVPVLTDVHWPGQAAVAAEAGVDVLQVPAFLCRQTDLIAACAATGLATLIKKGQFLSPAEMLQVGEKARGFGAKMVLLCERGASFGYNNLVADMRSLAVMRAGGFPVVFDATHSAQLPGALGGASGGEREMVAPLARAAAAVGVDGVFTETHPHPDKALSDAATQWPLDDFGKLADSLLAIDKARRESGN